MDLPGQYPEWRYHGPMSYRWAMRALAISVLAACASGGGDPSIPTEGGNGGVGGSEEGGGGSAENPCVTECGDEERCEAAHAGRDDDCDGNVDEGCSCNAGQVQECFK